MEANAKENIEVPLITLVIGPNYVKALQLPEVFATKVGVHIHSKLLGWWIVEPLYNQNKSGKIFNKTLVKSVVTIYPGNRYFTQSDKVRDISIEGVLKKMCGNN